MASTPSEASTRSSPTAGQPVDLLVSVAGEEDPGASIDLAGTPGRSDQPAGGGADQVRTPRAPMSPGDEAAPGTPGTGEDVCPECGGSGRVDNGTCSNCEGTGRVTVGIGGA